MRRTLIAVLLCGLICLLGTTIGLAYNEAPMLRTMVAAGELPPVEERLPEDPVIVEPVEEIGQYGGTATVVHSNPQNFEDGVNIMGKESMLSFDPSDGSTVLPNLAKSWIFSKDAKTLTLYLRKGLKWSDGVPFTADDIMFWYEDVVLNDELTPVKPTLWSPAGKLMEVEKVNDYTIRLHFATSYPVALVALGSWATENNFYLPKHYLKQFHPRYTPEKQLEQLAKSQGYTSWFEFFLAKATLGYFDGIQNPDAPVIRSFKIIKKTPEMTLLQRNPYYFKIDPAGNQLPYIDNIQLQLVQDIEAYATKVITGEVDLAQWNLTLDNYTLYKSYEDRSGYRALLYTVAWPSMVELFLNLNNKDPVLREIFNNRNFRIALSVGINRNEINKSVFYGKGEPLQIVILPRGGRFWDERLAKLHTEYDPAKANELLDQIGLKWDKSHEYRLRPDGKPLTIVLLYWPSEGGAAKTSIMELVKEYWAGLGINLLIKSVERGYLGTCREAGDFDLTLWHTGQCSDPLWILNPYHYIPNQWECSYGPQWALWYTSKGKSGEEPPDEIKKAIRLWEEAKISLDERKVIENTKEMLRIVIEGTYTIGTVGNLPTPIVVSKTLRNVPETGYSAWDWVYLARYHPEQFFFKK